MVASGVPNSCAAAAASPPSADSRCSRASTDWVTFRASSMRPASAAARQALPAVTAIPQSVAAAATSR